jgi:hypothetical protein
MNLLHRELEYCIYPYEIIEDHWYDPATYKEVVVTRVDVEVTTDYMPSVVVSVEGKLYQVPEHWL